MDGPVDMEEQLQLTAKRQEIVTRLTNSNPYQCVSVSDASSSEKKDFHWDYVMKEMVSCCITPFECNA